MNVNQLIFLKKRLETIMYSKLVATLFAILSLTSLSKSTQSLYTIDKDTATTTLVGSTGLNAEALTSNKQNLHQK